MKSTYVFPAILKMVGGKKEVLLPQFAKTIEIMPEDSTEKTVGMIKELVTNTLKELIAERKALPQSLDISNLPLSEGEHLLFVEVDKLKKPYTMADRVRHMRQISGF